MTPFLPAPLAGQAKVCPSRSRGARAELRRAATLGRDRDEVAQSAEPGERLALELADALPRQVELVPDRLERPRLALEAEPKLEDAPLPLGERVERARRARELLLPLDHVHGHADRAGVVRDGALHRLAEPPGGVGRELVAAP